MREDDERPAPLWVYPPTLRHRGSYIYKLRIKRKQKQKIHLRDVSGYRKRKMFYMLVLVVPLPREPFGCCATRDQYVLILTIPHGYSDGGVVEQETIPLPRRRGLSDPVEPSIEEVLMDEFSVDAAEVELPRRLAKSVASSRYIKC